MWENNFMDLQILITFHITILIWNELYISKCDIWLLKLNLKWYVKIIIMDIYNINQQINATDVLLAECMYKIWFMRKIMSLKVHNFKS